MNLLIPSNRIISAGILLVVLIFFSACGANKTVEDREQFNQLQELVNSREFQIEHQWVRPSWGGSINLIGNTNFIRFKGDSVHLSLPYYGVRYAGGGYGSDGGIEYKGPVKNLKISTNHEDQEIVLEFQAHQGIESLHFYLKLFSNNEVSTTVTSSQRATISYRGEIAPLPDEKE